MDQNGRGGLVVVNIAADEGPLTLPKELPRFEATEDFRLPPSGRKSLVRDGGFDDEALFGRRPGKRAGSLMRVRRLVSKAVP